MEVWDEEQATLSGKVTPEGVYKRLKHDELIVTPRKHRKAKWEQRVALLVCP